MNAIVKRPLVCRAQLQNNRNTITSINLRSKIIKQNYIHAIETHQKTLTIVKQQFTKHTDIIDKLEGSNDYIIYDLKKLGTYETDTYIGPTVKTFIRSIILKYLYQYRNDQDILEFFAYILNKHECI